MSIFLQNRYATWTNIKFFQTLLDLSHKSFGWKKKIFYPLYFMNFEKKLKILKIHVFFWDFFSHSNFAVCSIEFITAYKRLQNLYFPVVPEDLAASKKPVRVVLHFPGTEICTHVVSMTVSHLGQLPVQPWPFGPTSQALTSNTQKTSHRHLHRII